MGNWIMHSGKLPCADEMIHNLAHVAGVDARRVVHRLSNLSARLCRAPSVATELQFLNTSVSRFHSGMFLARSIAL
ncbi:hypothetical protein PENSPDRAFT_695586 [Peniophora sp. CONT]|nr:hypothetical protein PENSPDRAFT_695586 [Peniophora sp. CONT]